jgi:hypothetical protein
MKFNKYKYGMTLSGKKFIPSFVKNYQLFQNIITGGRTQRHSITVSLFSSVCSRLTLLFSTVDVTGSTQTYEMYVLRNRTSLYGIHECSSDVRSIAVEFLDMN